MEYALLYALYVDRSMEITRLERDNDSRQSTYGTLKVHCFWGCRGGGAEEWEKALHIAPHSLCCST